MSNLKIYCKNNKTDLLTCFISTYLFGLIAHAYGLLNNIFSHDALNALYADNTENLAKISVGRFMVPIVRYITRGQLAIPWIIGITALFYLSVSVYLIVKIFNADSKISCILISGLLVTNITVTGCIASYVHEFDLDMLALMLAVFSVYLWKKQKGFVCSILSVVLIVISLGIYQSNVTVVATLIICSLLLDLFNGSEFKNVFKKGIFGVIEIAAGTIIYYTLSKAAIKLAGVDTLSRADALNISDSLTADVSYLNGFNSMIFYEIQKIINPVSVLPKIAIILGNVLILIIGIAVAVLCIHKIGKKNIKEKLLSLVLTALLPVAIGCICIITKGELHDIMTFAFWLIPVFIVVLMSRFEKSNVAETLKKITAVISYVCFAVTIWNGTLVANTAYLKKDLEHDATLSIMTRMAHDLDKRDDYVPGETKVYIIGSDFIKGRNDEFNEVENIVGLDYNTSIGMSGKEWYYCSYEKYFVNYLGQPLIHTDNSFITDEIHESIMKMPSFPRDGYMEKFNDILVIRMN